MWHWENSFIRILAAKELSVYEGQKFFISPLTVKPGGLQVSLLSVCPSVCPSVSPLGVCPLGFPDSSQSSFEILTWNLVYEFVLAYLLTGIFCGCLIFAEFSRSLEIAEIKNCKIFQSRYNDEIVSEMIVQSLIFQCLSGIVVELHVSV